MIEFEDVSKIYKKKFIAVKNINLKIDKGEFVFLVGKSGAGKTTMVKLLLKEIDPSSGKIYYSGDNITKIRRHKIAEYRNKIGFIFQDYKLLPGKNVYQNVAFAMEVIGEKNSSIKHRVPIVLDMVGLSKKIYSNLEELSGGELQRVAIARAIINNPEVIVADEPTGNLDPMTSKVIMEIFDDINAKTNATVIMATHDKDIVNRMGKRVIEIKHGVICRDEENGRYENEI